MYNLVKQEISLNLFKDFTTIKDEHSHYTRQTKNSKFFLPFVSKSFAQNQLAFRGTKLWSEIGNDLNSKTINFAVFQKTFRKETV